MGITAELHASPKRVKKPPTYPPMQLTAAPQQVDAMQPMAAPHEVDPLAHVLAWAKAQRPNLER